MIRAIGKLIFAMINPKMFCKTDIHQSIVTAPLVGVDDDVKPDISANNGLQRAFLAIGNDLGIDPSVSLENAEDNRLAARSATSFAADPFSAKIRFVDLDLSGPDRCMTSTFFDQANTDFLKDRINTFPSNKAQLGSLAGRQIHRKIPQYLTKLLLGNSGTAI